MKKAAVQPPDESIIKEKEDDGEIVYPDAGKVWRRLLSETGDDSLKNREFQWDDITRKKVAAASEACKEILQIRK